MNKKWLNKEWFKQKLLTKKWLNKKTVSIGLIGVLILGGGYWGYHKFMKKTVTSNYVTKTAKIGDITKEITATGTVSFPHSIPLQFSSNGDVAKGQVVELNIKDGDTVTKGQVLARIDDTDLQATVEQEQANLVTAQAKLQSLYDDYTEQTKAEAESDLAKAKESLTTAEHNADSDYLANKVLQANQKVKQASDDLAKAQQNGEASSIQSAQSSLTQAIDDLTTAKNLQSGGAAQALAAAQADYTAAQYKVKKQEQGPSAADVVTAKANITQAEAQVESAKAKLAEATITAPTDAIVVDCGMQLYQYTTDSSAITITPVGSSFEVDASIDQADIPQVKVGQTVDITLDAYPNEHSTGTVSLVALQGTTTSNVTTYTVTVSVTKASDKLRSGMNANVNIIVSEAKNVLTVPSEAIKTVSNKTQVMVPATTESGTNKTSGKGKTDANVKYVTVEVGLDDGTNAEIKSGLKAGQKVVTSTISKTSSSSSNSSTKSSTKKSSSGLLGGGGPTGGPPN